MLSSWSGWWQIYVSALSLIFHLTHHSSNTIRLLQLHHPPNREVSFANKTQEEVHHIIQPHTFLSQLHNYIRIIYYWNIVRWTERTAHNLVWDHYLLGSIFTLLISNFHFYCIFCRYKAWSMIETFTSHHTPSTPTMSPCMLCHKPYTGINKGSQKAILFQCNLGLAQHSQWNNLVPAASASLPWSHQLFFHDQIIFLNHSSQPIL